MATLSSSFAWRIPMDRGTQRATVHGVQSVGHNWSHLAHYENGLTRGVIQLGRGSRDSNLALTPDPTLCHSVPLFCCEGFLRGSEGFPKNRGGRRRETASEAQSLPLSKIPVLKSTSETPTSLNLPERLILLSPCCSWHETAAPKAAILKACLGVFLN